MQFKTDHGIKYAGMYRGKVLKHCDAGKCKVFVPGVYPDYCEDNPDQLPDAEQASPLFGGCANGNGCFSYPNINTVVWCFFENGDQNRPVYFASTLGGELATESVDEGFQRVRENPQESGSKADDTTRNGQDSYTHMVNCGNTRILLTESGEATIICKNPDNPDQEFATIWMNSDGTMIVQSTQSIEIDAPSIKIDAEDSIEMNTTTMQLNASQEMYIKTPMFTSVNSNSATIKSPSIDMDGTEGTFIASGKNHPPLYLT